MSTLAGEPWSSQGGGFLLRPCCRRLPLLSLPRCRDMGVQIPMRPSARVSPKLLAPAHPCTPPRPPCRRLLRRPAPRLAVKQRMKSVANIQKITKAMKMVAASKMRSAQVNTENSRGIVAPLVRLLGDLPAAQGTKNVFVPVTSDKGLCGGINSTVCK